MDWSVEEHFSERDAHVISEGVLRFGRAEAAGGDARPIGCFLRDRGEVIGGATGRTEFRRLFVNFLWVRDDLRGRGYGTGLLARIEHAARVRGAVDSLIETLSDRNAELYRSLGYQPLATIVRAVGPFTRHILLKPLERTAPPDPSGH
jgi:GNAT superfamily N-acetyltransferase